MRVNKKGVLSTSDAHRALIEFLIALIESADVANEPLILPKVIGWQRLLKLLGYLPGTDVQGYYHMTPESVARDLLNLIAEIYWSLVHDK